MMCLQMIAFLVVFTVAAAQIAVEHPYCLPPPTSAITIDSTCAQGLHMNDPNYNCHGAAFVPSAGFYQPCATHVDCYESREPNDWCPLARNFRWSTSGCHCDKKLLSCVMERVGESTDEFQWSYCTPVAEFDCGRVGRCSF